MNEVCGEVCKHKEYCKLDRKNTLKCEHYDSAVDETFGKGQGDIMGYTTQQISTMQGRPNTDLKK